MSGHGPPEHTMEEIRYQQKRKREKQLQQQLQQQQHQNLFQYQQQQQQQQQQQEQQNAMLYSMAVHTLLFLSSLTSSPDPWHSYPPLPPLTVWQRPDDG
jgi:hypothetical protein